MPQSEALTKTKPFVPKLYSVILHNDDITTMDFVVDVIVTIFNKNFDDAIALMLKIHESGLAICGVYEKEIAKSKQQSVLKAAKVAGFPLKCSIELE